MIDHHIATILNLYIDVVIGYYSIEKEKIDGFFLFSLISFYFQFEEEKERLREKNRFI